MTTTTNPARLLRRPLETAIDRHLRLVDQPIAAGVAPPAEWAALRGRLDRFAALAGTPLRDKLIDAVVNGTDDADLPLLRANALAEANPQFRQPVFAEVREAAGRRLIELWEEGAVDAYREVAEQFDSAAAKFTAAAQAAGDPEVAADTLLGASDKVRKAWLDAERLARELDRRTTTLPAAAALADLHLRDDVDLLPLVCDPHTLHRRRVWEAWDREKGRCGRWSALVALGVRLRAWPADELDGFEPYRKSRPFVTKAVREPDQPYGEYKSAQLDPEDPPELQAAMMQPEPEPRPARKRARALAQ